MKVPRRLATIKHKIYITKHGFVRTLQRFDFIQFYYFATRAARSVQKADLIVILGLRIYIRYVFFLSLFLGYVVVGRRMCVRVCAFSLHFCVCMSPGR